MRLAAIILLMPLGIIFTGLLWFASLWIRHQEDHAPEADEITALEGHATTEFWHHQEACQ